MGVHAARQSGRVSSAGARLQALPLKRLPHLLLVLGDLVADDPADEKGHALLPAQDAARGAVRGGGSRQAESASVSYAAMRARAPAAYVPENTAWGADAG